jgi:hypothetical protein
LAATSPMLSSAQPSDHKSIGDFTLFQVMKLAINSTNQPSTNNVLEQLLKVINHDFNFRKKVSVNMELTQSNVAQMATHGIVICVPQLTLTLLANIETATKSSMAVKFAPPCTSYTRSTRTTTCMTQLCCSIFSKSWRVPMAYTSSRTHRHRAQRLRTWLPNQFPTSKQMMDTESAYTKLAYGVSSNSNSSEEECKPRTREHMLQVTRWPQKTEEGQG